MHHRPCDQIDMAHGYLPESFLYTEKGLLRPRLAESLNRSYLAVPAPEWGVQIDQLTCDLCAFHHLENTPFSKLSTYISTLPKIYVRLLPRDRRLLVLIPTHRLPTTPLSFVCRSRREYVGACATSSAVYSKHKIHVASSADPYRTGTR